MRTKTLLGLAALAVSAVTAVAADNVYSLNVVGYVNVPIQANTVDNGFYIACNPLQVNDAVNGNNKLNSVIPVTSVPAATTLYRYDVLTQSYITAQATTDDDGNPMWSQPSWTLAPGEGFWVKNPTATAFNITFVGEVLQGTQNNPIPAGFSLVGSQVPQSADLTTVMNYPAVNGDYVYLFTPGLGYATIQRTTDDDGNPIWGGTYPVGAPAGTVSPAVGQGFWAKVTTATTWTRTFNVP